ncbi:MAG: methyltransferase domain-containing protein [Gammaproteobacteria bacterium]|nr:methyltransferase domain-containing protein [Gammaproteobacteria bacterium]DAC82013.1 TPA_exp: methyltransferase [uncultured Gammaproteobacteria bacterium]
MTQHTSPEKISEMYDSPEGQLGPMLFGGDFHWGYWDESNINGTFANASDRLTQEMIKLTDIQSGQRFCDIGCGVGSPGLKLVSARDCYLDGITISSFQQKDATRRAQEAGLQDNARFFHGNAIELPWEDQSYDGGWFFESIFHMGHEKALSEAGRVLKPGASIVLADLPLLPHTTREFIEFAGKHIQSYFVELGDYESLMANAGFELESIDDVSKNVMPLLGPKLAEAIDLHRDDVLKVVDEKAIDDWIYLFEYMSENLGYMLVKARKR